MRTAKFAVRLPNTGIFASPDSIMRIALEAEYLGFDAVTVPDRVCWGPATWKYLFGIGTAEKVDEFEKLGLSVHDLYESVTLLSYIAGMTKRIKLLPSTWLLPLRHPVLFAKQAATLHELSGGRLIFCVGIGGIEEDFAAMGIPFKRRGRIMDEYLQAIKRLFSTDGNVSFEGKYVSFVESGFSPKPRNIPIWIAGTMAPVVYERIAKYGDGWVVSWRTDESPESCRKAMPVLNDFMKKYGRDVSELEVGRLTFTCLGTTTGEARKVAEHTIRSFFAGKGEDPVRRTFETSFIGTTDNAIKITQEYLDAGLNVHDMRLIAPSIEAAIDMMKVFSKEVISCFR